MENIIVTDGYTLNPGDLSWEEFKKFGALKVYPRIPEDSVAEICRDATIIITNKTRLDATSIENAANLKLIGVTATGYNVVDVEACRKNGIIVSNVPGYGTDSVAQHTFALLLELTNHVGENAFEVKNGAWSASDDWCFTKKPIVELSGKVIGIIGYGRIGQKVSEIANAFGMKIIFHNRSPKNGIGSQVSVEEIFRESDFVTLHCPLHSDNHSFVNRTLLSMMKPGSFLINTARGQLIQEQDLADALKSGNLKGAALDVLSKEPPPPEHPLIGLPNCIVTPHNAWLSYEARRRILDTTYLNIETALLGRPQNLVW